MSYEKAIARWRDQVNADSFEIGIQENLEEYFFNDHKEYNLRLHYGLTLDDYENMYDKQG